jgi:hypothetical protein
MATKLQPPPNVAQDVNTRQWKDWLYSIYSAVASVGGLGTMASQNANNVSISGGTIGGVALSGDNINNTPIGAINPSTGAFTNLSSSGTVSGTGFSNYLASPPPIGSTAPNRVNTNALKTTGLTGYLYGNDNTGDVTASTTVPYTDVTTVPYGAFHDTTTQTAAAATITAITFNSTDYSNNVAIGSPTSRIVVSKAGTYSVTFSIQASNSSASVDNITVWFRINGTDVANSAGISAIPAKHAGTNGALVFGWTAYYTFTAGQYLQMYWTTDSGTSSLDTYPAGTSPTHPLSPSVALSLNYIAP